jgi:hypothetical protein
MATSSIGELVVNLTLKSADFISNLNKAASSVNANTGAMKSSLSNVEKAVAGVTTAFAAFATDRMIRRVIQMTDASLKLAASMQGPLGTAAQEFLSQFEDLQKHFEIGLSVGFLNGLNDGLMVTQTELVNSQKEGEKLGVVFSKIYNDAAHFFLRDFPDGVSQMGKELDALGNEMWDISHAKLPDWLSGIDAINDKLVDMVNTAFKFAGISLRIPTSVEMNASPLVGPDTSKETDAATQSIQKLAATYQTLADKILLAEMETTDFWKATVATTAAGEDLLKVDESHLSVIEKIGAPMERYALALSNIARGNYSAADATRLQTEAVLQVGQAWLQVASTASGALESIFKGNKAFAIGNAVINTAGAIVKTLEQYGMTPIGIAAAAAAAAAGAAQIAAIEAAQPGGGSSGSTATTAKAETPRNPTGGPQQAISINLQGDTFTRATLENLVGQLKLYQQDGGTILLQ